MDTLFLTTLIITHNYFLQLFILSFVNVEFRPELSLTTRFQDHI